MPPQTSMRQNDALRYIFIYSQETGEQQCSNIQFSCSVEELQVRSVH